METVNNTNNAQTTTETKTEPRKIGQVEKFFGSTGLAMHRSMQYAHDYAKSCPIMGTVAYAVAAPWAVTTAPVLGLFHRKAYDEYAHAEEADAERMVDYDFVNNKVVEIPSKQRTPAQTPSASSLVWGGVAATAILVGGILGAMSRNED